MYKVCVNDREYFFTCPIDSRAFYDEQRKVFPDAAVYWEDVERLQALNQLLRGE